MKERDISIDILRGIAIFTMIAANMAPYNYVEPHPVGFRIFGSVAAPMFVFLAGMMVAFTTTVKAHPLKYYLKRGFATIAMAAFIDGVIWDILPLVTFDVLYIIGLSMPLIFFFLKLNKMFQLVLIGLIFSITPLLQYYLGYVDVPSEVVISEGNVLQNVKEIPVWRQFLFEGWFPFFPWIGVAFAGAFVGTFKFKIPAEDFNKKSMLVGLALFATGLFFWLIINPNLTSNESFDGSAKTAQFWKTLITREGYSELFYPPTLFYFFTFIGGILILIPLAFRVQHFAFLKPLTVFGKSSMLVYLLHTVLIAYIFSNEESIFGNIGQKNLLEFIGLFLLHSLLLWIICFGWQKFKKGKKFPFIVNFIFGG